MYNGFRLIDERLHIKREVRTMKTTETCNECGCSVERGSGLFVNRVPDMNDKNTREEMGKPFPKGDFICVECDK